MAYETASKCFNENRGFVTPPGNDYERSYRYNTNQGLAALTEAIARDMAQLDARLQRIEMLLRQLASR